MKLKLEIRKVGRMSDENSLTPGQRLILCFPECCLEECLPLREAVRLVCYFIWRDICCIQYLHSNCHDQTCSKYLLNKRSAFEAMDNNGQSFSDGTEIVFLVSYGLCVAFRESRCF